MAREVTVFAVADLRAPPGVAPADAHVTLLARLTDDDGAVDQRAKVRALRAGLGLQLPATAVAAAAAPSSAAAASVSASSAAADGGGGVVALDPAARGLVLGPAGRGARLKLVAKHVPGRGREARGRDRGGSAPRG